MNVLQRWFGGAERDGAAAVLEEPATEIGAALLSPEPESGDRRRRGLDPTRTVMRHAMAKQVLNGWLQNRHQTLLPLTVNLRGFPEAQSDLLVATMAAGLLSSSMADEAARQRAADFLKTSGASQRTFQVLEAALAAPRPLVRLFEEVRAQQTLAPLAYILLVVVNDTRDPANAIFLQWAAAKLELRSTVVRSVERRYRR